MRSLASPLEFRSHEAASFRLARPRALDMTSHVVGSRSPSRTRPWFRKAFSRTAWESLPGRTPDTYGAISRARRDLARFFGIGTLRIRHDLAPSHMENRVTLGTRSRAPDVISHVFISRDLALCDPSSISRGRRDLARRRIITIIIFDL